MNVCVNRLITGLCKAYWGTVIVQPFFSYLKIKCMSSLAIYILSCIWMYGILFPQKSSSVQCKNKHLWVLPEKKFLSSSVSRCPWMLSPFPTKIRGCGLTLCFLNAGQLSINQNLVTFPQTKPAGSNPAGKLQSLRFYRCVSTDLIV